MKRAFAEPDIITKNGKPVSVILPIKDYREIMERLEDAEDIAYLERAHRKPLHFRPLEDVLDDLEKKCACPKSTSMHLHYEISIYWSKAEHRFVAEVPELPGCTADGTSYEKAVANAQVVIQEWIDTARSLGRPIPEPRGKLTYA